MLGWAIRLTCLVAAMVFAANVLINHREDALLARPGDAGRSQTAALATADAPPLQYSGNEMIIPVAADGHFYVNATIEGTDVAFLVDTGASGVFLNRDAAESLGFDLESLDYSIVTKTANGFGRAAPIMLNDLRVEEIYLDDVNAIVNDAPMSISLLGMSFLSRLESYEVRNGHMILRW